MSSINPSTDKCLWTARLLRDSSNDYQCIPCFINASLQSPLSHQITITNLLVKHCFVRGPYTPCICERCSKNITREKPVNECSLCNEKCTELLAKLTLQGIQAGNALFMYDVHGDDLIYLNVTP